MCTSAALFAHLAVAQRHDDPAVLAVYGALVGRKQLLARAVGQQRARVQLRVRLAAQLQVRVQLAVQDADL